ncbi:Protein kinase-like domain protein [Metarhizium album ARSEF 1941]|uniref:non-specific serine/threonine protein kinase n=1 Tax=Metarhizium album (strain ARSEF 1941) TaxID=1081103 RepID=A0A0B2WXM5_METAS|nr:Protein kinase-like domain protein [Metarhizium album ARSEF 1941]KHN97620.1 Protein kinase-like domain protein [Metarhizium album ARSEF 1941]
MKNGRYQVINKLGWDSWSTTWIAQDFFPDDIHDHIFVSLKVWTAARSRNLGHVQAMRDLYSSLHNTTYHVLRMIDVFEEPSHRGVHLCFVMEMYGPTLESIIFEHSGALDSRMNTDVILMVTDELLNAISRIHEAGYGYGDIHCTNIVFTLPAQCRREMRHLRPVIGPMVFFNLCGPNDENLNQDLPYQIVQSPSFGWHLEEIECIRLVNSSVAVASGRPSTFPLPPENFPPEFYFPSICDHRIDLWSAGIVIYMMLFRDVPFKDVFSPILLIRQMIGFMEDLPEA